jgi:asparaginyl-tRNA synthetase
MDQQVAMPPEIGAHLTSPVTRDVLAIQHRLLAAAREHLEGLGFVEMLPAIIGPVTDPGGRGAKQVDVDYYGHKYKLMTSAILYKQASLAMFDKIFYVAPNVRLEPAETATTGRHLTEFHQVDVEIKGGTRDDAMAVAESMVVHMVDAVVTRMPDVLARLGQDRDTFKELLEKPFGRRTHSDAVAELHGLGHAQSAGAEIDWVGEEILSRKSDRPFFVTDYPKGSRGFYDKENQDRPGHLVNFDLIAPAGFGELVSGSQREYEYASLITRMRETAENPAKYDWYLKLAREGLLPPSAGFGLGMQRLTRYVTGVDAVWQATAFPKLPGIPTP